MHQILTIYHLIQAHPLDWQMPLTLGTTTGLFEWAKRKTGLENPKKITAYLSVTGVLIVLIHFMIIGATFSSVTGLVKLTAQQTLIFSGALGLVYNFLTRWVTTFLLDAKAKAVASQSSTPAQKNQVAQPTTAAEAGVVQI